MIWGVHGPGGAWSQGGGGAWSRGVAWSQGVHGPGGVPGGDPPLTATAAGGMHPTGMHSCSNCSHCTWTPLIWTYSTFIL